MEELHKNPNLGKKQKNPGGRPQKLIHNFCNEKVGKMDLYTELLTLSTIVVLTDRDELNRQISDTFENCGLLGKTKASQFIASSGADLVKKLQGNPSLCQNVEILTEYLQQKGFCIKKWRLPLSFFSRLY